MSQLRILMLDPYHGGSHAAFARSLQAHSRHAYTVLTLPARKWKWRMRGASTWFARSPGVKLPGPGDVDVIMCTDMLSLPDLKALFPPHLSRLPTVAYFHENQLTYPIPDESDRDYQYGMTNITSALAADAVWFNSAYHLEAFMAAADRLLGMMPDYVPPSIVDAIRTKSWVFHPPVEISRPPRIVRETPVILWNHRWEYDKNPGPFFAALIELADENRPFEIILTGEQFRTAPAEFAQAAGRLSSHVLHEGYIPSRDAYLQQLGRCDFAVSTAIQENFGIAMVEAMGAGCEPVCPNRLSYPEITPVRFHGEILFAEDADLAAHLRRRLSAEPNVRAAIQSACMTHVEQFAPHRAVPAMDDALEALHARVTAERSG